MFINLGSFIFYLEPGVSFMSSVCDPCVNMIGTICFIHLFIDLSIVLPLTPVNSNIRESISLSLLVFWKDVSFCTVTNAWVLMNGQRMGTHCG